MINKLFNDYFGKSVPLEERNLNLAMVFFYSSFALSFARAVPLACASSAACVRKIILFSIRLYAIILCLCVV